MPRPRALFEIASLEELPREATLRVGDVLRIEATGVFARGDVEVVEVVGPLTLGVLSSSVPLLPAGGPNVLLIVARKPGALELDIVFGSAWGSRDTGTISVTVK